MKTKPNKKNNTANKSGFTLAETIVTVSIFTILMLGTTLMLRDILSSNTQEYSLLTNTTQANIIADHFVNELRNGTYGANGAYTINQASNTQLTFFSTGINNNGTISKIRYYITGNTLYKGVTNPAGSPPSYDGQTEKITALSNNMSIGNNPLFYYYDGNYSGTGTPLGSPININQIKFVKMNLTILKQLLKDSNTTFTSTPGASIRNLKNNLGN